MLISQVTKDRPWPQRPSRIEPISRRVLVSATGHTLFHIPSAPLTAFGDPELEAKLFTAITGVFQ
jgi:hypothetical protein